jgi:hypothetical protein
VKGDIRVQLWSQRGLLVRVKIRSSNRASNPKADEPTNEKTGGLYNES